MLKTSERSREQRSVVEKESSESRFVTWHTKKRKHTAAAASINWSSCHMSEKNKKIHTDSLVVKSSDGGGKKSYMQRDHEI
jgi:hypothetical protein